MLALLVYGSDRRTADAVGWFPKGLPRRDANDIREKPDPAKSR
jgi:hypothetical protein